MARGGSNFFPLLFLFGGIALFWLWGAISKSMKESTEREAKGIAERMFRNKESEIQQMRAKAVDDIEKEKKRLLAQKERSEAELSNTRKMVQKRLDERRTEIANNQAMFEKMLEEKTVGFPWVAELFGRYKAELAEQMAENLTVKSNPAHKAADELRKIKSVLRKTEAERKTFEGLLAYYEALFPWLTDFRDAPDEIISSKIAADGTLAEDAAMRYLSDGEWNSLSQAEKFQKALDRYWNSPKNNWEIGRLYERYIGYLYEKDGYDVEYYGSIKGFEDMGRDIIATKGRKTHIVQCKYWKKEKAVHEKHVFQLFGTSVVYSMDSGLEYKKNVTPVFAASCCLSETAKKVAEALGVVVKENVPFEPYPLIKCNVSKDGEKIYHLPFDQQYDKIKMSKGNGEMYVPTVAEAENMGFRRAYRWRGSS